MGKLDTLEHTKRDTLNNNIIQIRSYSSGSSVDLGCCKKEAQELRKELGEVKTEMKSLNKLVGIVGDQVDRYSSVEAELKDQIQRMEARTDTKTLSEKIGEFEQMLAQHSDYVETVECKIAKNYRQCE